MHMQDARVGRGAESKQTTGKENEPDILEEGVKKSTGRGGGRGRARDMAGAQDPREQGQSLFGVSFPVPYYDSEAFQDRSFLAFKVNCRYPVCHPVICIISCYPPLRYPVKIILLYCATRLLILYAFTLLSLCC